MSIILELQEQALQSDTDILSLLRKAYLVARKLDLKEFQEWINNELNGYKDFSIIPSYRHIVGELKAWNPCYGWIAVLIEDTELERTFSQKKIHDSIPSINALLSKNGESIAIPISGSGAAIISKFTEFESRYILKISFNLINDIIEQVKNRILDWAIILEENGIAGEGLSFTSEEKLRAHSESQIINYINNFNSSVTDLQLQQGTNYSNQEK